MVPARLTWAVDVLDPRPDEVVLEIGCGNGAAAGLVADRLTGGHIVALDRSATATGRAEQTLAGHIRAGRAQVQQAALGDASLPDAGFDAAFAVNVNVFWLKPVAELAVLRRLFRPPGRLVLAYQPPSPGRADEMLKRLHANLAANGFLVTDTQTRELERDVLLAVCARRIGPPS